MNKQEIRWGLMGGTFNPVHHGHLITARWAGELLGLDRVGLMPNQRSPLRMGEPLAPADVRLEMVRAAVAEEPMLEALDVEVSRGGTSLLVETLEELRNRNPERDWVFLMGADSLTTFDRWVRVEAIVQLAEVRVLPRPGLDAPGELDRLFQRLPALQGKIRILPQGPCIELSATEIRRRRHKGLSVRYMVPDAVAEVMEREGLYGDGSPSWVMGH